MSEKRKGALGEERAASFLVEKGYTILERNFKCRRGEIDIIAKRGDEVIFVEVKTWDSLSAGDLEYSIGSGKQRRIIDSSRYFLLKHPEQGNSRFRFDVILLEEGRSKISHIRGAFTGVREPW